METKRETWRTCTTDTRSQTHKHSYLRNCTHMHRHTQIKPTKEHVRQQTLSRFATN